MTLLTHVTKFDGRGFTKLSITQSTDDCCNKKRSQNDQKIGTDWCSHHDNTDNLQNIVQIWCKNFIFYRWRRFKPGRSRSDRVVSLDPTGKR